MKRNVRILFGVAMTFLTVAIAYPQADYDAVSRPDTAYADYEGERNGYSYVRDTVGGVTVVSRFNGRVSARRNMPISAGDEIIVTDAGRAEVGLADGNLLFVGGGTRARFSSLYAQQGEDDDFSAIDLRDGSVVLAAIGADEGAIPRIDTESATVYLAAGSRVRVNADPRRGTVVVVRAGSAEVRTRADSYTVEAGSYLLVDGDEEPELARGVFSRDRFDLWASDRLEELYSDTTRSASVRYTDDDYASEVVALDDYGDWEYSSTYSTQVWTPRVSVGWSPYSHGSWYYTSIGLSWWSYDPWGWYPHHYGTWYFDRHWSWVPSYVYSPAWVYWAYTPRYVGWCPVGYYSYYSPWFNDYYRSWGWNSRYSRSASLYFAISGTFRTRDVDFGGWNFVNSGNFGSGYDPISVVSGSRLMQNLGDHIAISPKPIVVGSRGDSLPQALQNYAREMPSRIEKAKGIDSDRLAPVLGRQKALTASTVEALKERAVVAGRGKLGGPGAEALATRGAKVDRGGSVRDFLAAPGRDKGSAERESVFARDRKGIERAVPDLAGEKAERGGPARSEDPATDWRGRGKADKGDRSSPAPVESVERERPGKSRGGPEGFDLPREGKRIERSAPAPSAPADDWRGRAPAKGEGPSKAPSTERSKPGKSFSREENRPLEREDKWRGRPEPSFEARPAPAPKRSIEKSSEAWRGRSEAPAKRVIEGAVPGRRNQEFRDVSPRSKERAPSEDWRSAPRASKASPRLERRPESAPAPREYRSEPREKAPREYRPEMRSAPREYSAPRPEPREYRAPKEYRPETRSAPREYSAPRPEPREYRAPKEYRESRPAPAPRVERAPHHSAPAPGSAPSGKGHGKGRKG
ncbi:MAG TPA: DUF6600 domain-containing protein [Thermoanaerobaculia bacterium]|nr:DUF6600 domain-containing protein [Thermoanaerobaculia bacterium]